MVTCNVSAPQRRLSKLLESRCDQTSFDAWVSEAEQKFLLAADYPLIDDDQIDMAEKLRDCAQPLSGRVLRRRKHVNPYGTRTYH